MKTNDTPQAAPEHEIKYVFNNNYASVLANWLTLRCIPDPKFPSGVISSIYYDTRNWLLLNEKLNSDYLKSKFRVRWYESLGNTDHPDKSFVEVKSKIGATRRKIRFESRYSGKELAGMDLSCPELLDLQKKARAMGAELPFSLYPALQISYKRYRYLEPETRCRICIDFDILSPRVNRQMLPRAKPHSYLASGVVEVKGDIQELPHSLRQLTALGCRKQAFSKYSGCFAKVTGLFF